MSSASTRLPCRLCVTCPAAMRWASASASALLPTPGSPTGRGCFSGGGRGFRSRAPVRGRGRAPGPGGLPARGGSGRGRIFSLGLPLRVALMRGAAGSTSWPDSWRHSRAACGTSTPSPASQTLAVQAPSSSMAHKRCSLPARAARAACAPSTANSSALRLSGARSWRPRRSGRPSPARWPAQSLQRAFGDIFTAQELGRRALRRLQHSQQDVAGVRRAATLPPGQGQRPADGLGRLPGQALLEIQHTWFSSCSPRLAAYFQYRRPRGK